MNLALLAAFVISVSVFARQCEGAQEGVIISGPQTQIVAPGDIVYFYCYAQGSTVRLYINRSDPYPEDYYMAKGFNVTYVSNNDEHNITVIVEARLSNNDTLISCTARGQIHGQQTFEQGTLIVVDKPTISSFNMVQESVNDTNTFTYHLHWSEPFAWPGFPVVSYDVTVYNQSSNRTDTLTMYTNESRSLSLTYDGNSSGNTCYALNFSVSATNRVGKGDPATINSGHPIALGEIGEIEKVLTFLSNSTPHLWMSFYLPRICRGYQSGTYNITVSDNDGDAVYTFGPDGYTQSADDRGVLVVKEIRSGLIYGQNYSLEVMVSSLGSTTLKRETFSTVLNMDNVTVCRQKEVRETSEHQSYTSTESLVSNAGVQSCTSSESQSQLALAVGVSVGIAAVLLTCCCFGVAFVLIRKVGMKTRRTIPIMPNLETDGSLVPKQKPKKGKPSSLALNAKNPIYDGALYEITPGESLKCLMSPSSGGSTSVPCTPLAESAGRYTFDFPPRLPPIRKGSVSTPPTCGSVPSTPSAESASRYTFDFPPRLPPPRKGSVSIPPKLETHNEIDTKVSLGNGVIADDVQCAGDNEYMEMNSGLAKKEEERASEKISQTVAEDEYVSV